MSVTFRPNIDLRPGAVNYVDPGMGVFVPVGSSPNPPIMLQLPVVLPIHGSANSRRT